MQTLRKLSSVLVLTLMIGVPAFAGQTEGAPCAVAEPGQTEGPPCQGAAPGDSGGPSNSSTAIDEAITEIMTEVLESMLSSY